MAFREFRYLRDAQAGLDKLAVAGVPWEELVLAIRDVQQHWQPGDDDETQHVVPFQGHFLVFTVSRESPSTLVLADVATQPRG